MPMERAYVTAMIDSLKSKIEILKDIRKKNAEQLDLIKRVPFSAEDFDKNADEKGILIYKLNKLDNGFQIVYDNLKVELEENKAQYAGEIKMMQSLITEITELSTTIQAEEARNKAALENYFKGEHSKIKSGRSQSKAIKSYTQTMLNSGKR